MIDEPTLETLAIVANNTMNRERELHGSNGYDRELGFDVVDRLQGLASAAWLDVCCGSGRALVAAADQLPEAVLVGVDLVDHFWPASTDLEERVVRIVAPLRTFEPGRRFDLVTCVHGLHYVGDKLDALLRMRSWLRPTGRLAAHLDLATVRMGDRNASSADLRRLGLGYDRRRRLVIASGPGRALAAPRFIGAQTGCITYTGQPGVVGIYDP